MKYFSWHDKPAIIVSLKKHFVTGYYYRDKKWKAANIHQVASFYNTEMDFSADGHELTKEEFLSKFGNVLYSFNLDSKVLYPINLDLK